jgi:hypothetical protein
LIGALWIFLYLRHHKSKGCYVASTINIEKLSNSIEVDFGADAEALLGRCFESADGSALSFSISGSFLASDGVGKRAAIAIFMELTMGRVLERAYDGLAATPKSLSLDYISAPAEDWMDGRAHVVRRTRDVIFLQGELRSGGNIFSTATAVWSVDRSDQE